MEQESKTPHLGYITAILVPPVGMFYGLALIASGNEDDGPWVLGLALVCAVIYALAVLLGVTR